MKKIIFTLALGLLSAVGANAQDVQNTKGDWYLGTGNIADVSWTEWSVSPTIGYGVNDDLMVGLNLSQANSDADFLVDLHARYFLNVNGQDLFVYTSLEDVVDFSTDSVFRIFVRVKPSARSFWLFTCPYLWIFFFH